MSYKCVLVRMKTVVMRIGASRPVRKIGERIATVLRQQDCMAMNQIIGMLVGWKGPAIPWTEILEKLNAWTDKRWMVALSKAPGAPAGTIGRCGITGVSRL